MTRGGRGKGNGGGVGSSAGVGGRDLVGGLSNEVILDGIVRPFLSAREKCSLQRTCRHMQKLIDDPKAWERLDLRLKVIGTRTMKSGRQSRLSSEALFFVARSVIAQPRFSLVTTFDLRGMIIGAMARQPPDLLVKISENCPHVTTLNLWGACLQGGGFPLDNSLEELIATKMSGLQNLAIDMDAGNKGLKILIEGCRQLKSLHIGSWRKHNKPANTSPYPNDRGMEVFSSMGSPHLETLSLFHKANISATGLRCLFAGNSCPRLNSLVLTSMEGVTSECLSSLAPDMARLRELVVDHCPITPLGIQTVVECCQDLETMVVAGEQTVILENAEEGKPLMRHLHASTSSKLRTFKVEVRGWQIIPSGPVVSSHSIKSIKYTATLGGRAKESAWLERYSKEWDLRYDAETSSASSVSGGSGQPKIVVCQALSADDRIERFMLRAQVDGDTDNSRSDLV